MQPDLQQRGRASIDFLAALGGALHATKRAVGAELATAGLDNERLADDFDARFAQFQSALAQAPTTPRYVAIRELDGPPPWAGRDGGLR